jgi:hypothetical protein
MSTMAEQRSWYREPLVWLIIAFPLTAVVAGLATFYIAKSTHDGLVVDDYYQKGKEINRSLARDQAAARLGLRGGLHLEAASQTVIVELQSTAHATLPASVTLRWLHATRGGNDRVQQLERAADGRYRAAFPELAPGHWYAQLEAQDWRLQGSLHVPGEVRLELAAAPGAGPPAK